MYLLTKDAASYCQRTFDVHGLALQRYSTYVSIMKQQPYEEIHQKTLRLAEPGGPLAMTPRNFKLNYRNKVRTDRVQRTAPANIILNEIEKERLILSPSFTAYEHPDTYLSYQTEYIDANTVKRDALKKAAKFAKQKGELLEASLKNSSQVNKKTLNNSMSGVNRQSHNPNNTSSGHPSQTSNCRAYTSNANANVERLFMGNRHYYSFDVTIENLTTIIALMDLDAVERVIKEFNITVPEVDVVYDYIYSVAKQYWYSEDDFKIIYDYLSNMTDVQLSAVYYCANFKAFIDTSPEVLRAVFKDLLIEGVELQPLSVEQADKAIKETDTFLTSYISMLSCNELAGEILASLKTKNPEAYGLIGARFKYFTDTVNNKYADFLLTFFVNDVLPSSIFEFPSIIRHCVPGSDTDSSLYTTQNIVKWYTGDLKFDYISDSVRELASFLNAQMIAHISAKMSGQIGTVEKNIFRMHLKPEYSMPIMGFTNRMKHYFAFESGCEGLVYKDWELVTKGVALKNSKVEGWVIRALERWIEVLAEIIKEGRKITPLEAVSTVAYIEHRFISEYKKGNTDFLLNVNIKHPSEYSQSDNHVVKQRWVWDTIFGPKYGRMSDYPVSCKKVSINLKSAYEKQQFKEYLKQHDPAIHERYENYIAQHKSISSTMILVPTDFLVSNEIPEEILQISNINMILTNITESYYYILEMMGIHYKNNTTKTNPRTRFAYKEVPFDVAKENLIFDIESFIDL